MYFVRQIVAAEALISLRWAAEETYKAPPAEETEHNPLNAPQYLPDSPRGAKPCFHNNQAVIRGRPLPKALNDSGEIKKDKVVLLVKKDWGLWDEGKGRLAPIVSDVLQVLHKFHAPVPENARCPHWGVAFLGKKEDMPYDPKLVRLQTIDNSLQ